MSCYGRHNGTLPRRGTWKFEKKLLVYSPFTFQLSMDLGPFFSSLDLRHQQTWKTFFHVFALVAVLCSKISAPHICVMCGTTLICNLHITST